MDGLAPGPLSAAEWTPWQGEVGPTWALDATASASSALTLPAGWPDL